MIRNSLRAWVGGAIMAAASLHSYAAGLGPLEVKSVLGEPFRAEISVSAEPGEIESLRARLASPGAYEAAGLVYTGIVSQLIVTLTKNNGQALLSITSGAPINEPVIDLLLELAWSSGRVSREYTAFLDPPFIVAEREERRAREAAATAELADQGAETQAASLPDAPTPQPLPDEAVIEEVEEVEIEGAGATEAVVGIEEIQEVDLGPVEMIGGTDPTLFTAEPSVVSSGDISGASTYISGSPVGVIRGDTLSKIALANKPAGVTLEQMLVVLFRNNPSAFSGNNMNRLRTGKIIRLAEPQEYKAVTAQQARKEVRVQYADWNAYRDRLAAAAMQKSAAEQPAEQAAGGAVTPKVEDRAPSAAEKPSEVVKLSKGEPATAGQGGTGTDQAGSRALQEKLVASEKALKESTDRVARLEKIIEDLQKLAEVKNQDLAQLQSQAATPKGTEAPKPTAAAPVAKPEPAAAPKASPPVAGEPTSKEPGAPADPGQPAAAATSDQASAQAPAPLPAPTGAPAGGSAQAPTPAAQKPTRRPPPPPPPPPPSLLDQVMAQPYLLAVPLVVLLLVGFGVSRLRGRKRESRSETEEAAPARSGSSSTARAPGTFSPKDTDVGLASTRHGDGAEEVDPLEEAEIFLAYGRDAQAEELLKEAIATHPARYDVHVKLLEIYAKRKDKAAFEGLTKEIQRGTGGHGEIWDRTVRLGYSIDPQNPRYAEGQSDDADATIDSARSDDITSTSDRVDFEVGRDEGDDSDLATDFDPSATAEFESSPIVDPEATMDGTLDIDDLPTMQIRSNSGFTATDMDMSSDGGLTATDLDLNAELPVLDSDNTTDDSAADDAAEDASSKSDDDAGLDFNMDGISFGSGDAEQDDTEAEPASDMPALDLSGINLDLDGDTTSQTTSASGKDEKWYEVQTKFDLAKAYQEMGDSDGAKEILQEVISEGDSEQKAAAESVLATLD